MSFTYDFGQSHANSAYKGKTTVNTKLFINGEWVEGSGKTIDVINPTNGKKITEIQEGTAADVDKAVDAAEKLTRPLGASESLPLSEGSF